MNVITNNQGLSLAMAVWLAHDEYTDGSADHAGQNLISATALLKPTRQLVLMKRLPPAVDTTDVADLIASRFGHAIHESIEQAWTVGHANAMRRLGYPEKMIERIKINPTEVLDGDIPVYLEQRSIRPITLQAGEVLISGKFDQIINGEINDTKTTSVYAYINRSNEDYYQLQGSIYRWLNPTLVTSDLMRIQHVFTDWQRSQSKISPGYPNDRVLEFTVELLSLQETETWIRRKLNEVIANDALPEPELIRCTEEDLWMSDPIWKFYSDPAKAAQGGRSTKNFESYPAAVQHQNKAGKGIIVEVPRQAKRCAYCNAAPICTQKDEYAHA